MYDGKFYSQPYVTVAFLEPWHIQNAGIFRTLVHSEIKAHSERCRISKMEHFIKNPV